MSDNDNKITTLPGVEKVVALDVGTTNDVPPEIVLNGALEAGLECAIVIGIEKDQPEPGIRPLYFALSHNTRPEGIAGAHLLLSRAQRVLHKILDDTDQF